MGLRYRKSINLGGGFRVNLSKSGIGYSWGTKGYRVTKKAGGGVRKTYSIPGTGLSWSQDSGKSRKNNKSGRLAATGIRYSPQVNSVPQPVLYEATDTNTQELASEQTQGFIDAIKKYCQMHGILKWGAIITGIIMFSNPPIALLFIIFAGALIYHSNTSKIRVEYEFDEYGKRRIQMLDQAMSELMNTRMVWQIVTRVANASMKTNAGASSSVNRKPVKFIKKTPYFLKTDATCYNIRLQNDNIYILPDRIIVKGKKGWGAIEYSDLDIIVGSRTFIEDGTVPKDAEVIGYTWQYVNKNGSPDKRYKNNRQLPQCNYGSLTIVSGTAMNVLLYTSSISHTKKFLSIMNSMIKDAEEAKKSVPEQAAAEQMSLEENADNTEQTMLQYAPYANTDETEEQTQNEKATMVGRMVNALKASYENFLPDGIIEDEKEILLAYWEGLKENNLPTITACIRRADGSIGVTYKGKDIGSFYVRNNNGWLIHNVGNNGKTNRIEGNLDEIKKNVTKWHRYIINYL